jgi:hypothetical protein
MINRDILHTQVPLPQRALKRRQSCGQQRMGFLTLNMNLCPHRPFVHHGVKFQRAQGAGAKLHVHF